MRRDISHRPTGFLKTIYFSNNRKNTVTEINVPGDSTDLRFSDSVSDDTAVKKALNDHRGRKHQRSERRDASTVALYRQWFKLAHTRFAFVFRFVWLSLECLRHSGPV